MKTSIVSVTGRGINTPEEEFVVLRFRDETNSKTITFNRDELLTLRDTLCNAFGPAPQPAPKEVQPPRGPSQEEKDVADLEAARRLKK